MPPKLSRRRFLTTCAPLPLVLMAGAGPYNPRNLYRGHWVGFWESLQGNGGGKLTLDITSAWGVSGSMDLDGDSVRIALAGRVSARGTFKAKSRMQQPQPRVRGKMIGLLHYEGDRMSGEFTNRLGESEHSGRFVLNYFPLMPGC